MAPTECRWCGWSKSDHFGAELRCPCADNRHGLPCPPDCDACKDECDNKAAGHKFEPR